MIYYNDYDEYEDLEDYEPIKKRSRTFDDFTSLRAINKKQKNKRPRQKEKMNINYL